MNDEDKFDALLRSARDAQMDLPKDRTPNCPSENELRLLCREESDGELRRKYMDHVLFCGFCSNFIRAIVRANIRDEQSISESKKLFPLAEEIDWSRMKEVRLFKDGVCISQQAVLVGIEYYEFVLEAPGFYHITNDSAQVLWRREIEAGSLLLTDEEQERALDFGVAASKESNVPRIVSFRDKCWSDHLEIELVKRISGAVIIVRLRRRLGA